jgi:CheY-like chemotaxis protein
MCDNHHSIQVNYDHRIERRTDSWWATEELMDFARNHILVVDDYVDAVDTTVELLSIWGYDAIACYSGAAALESASIRRPDVILLDLAMPRMDGFQFARQFHKLPGCGLIPTIALSGFSSTAYRLRARMAGIHQYLLKPAEPALLRRLLARTILARAVSRGKRQTLSGVATQLCSVPTEGELVGAWKSNKEIRKLVTEL